MKRVLPALLAFLLLFSLLLGGCSLLSSNTDAAYIDLDSLPDYAGEAYVPLLPYSTNGKKLSVVK